MYNKDQIKSARKAELSEICNRLGLQLKREKEGEYRVPGYGGLLIEGNHWFWHNQNKGGNAIDFCMQVMGLDFDTALRMCVGVDHVEGIETRHKIKPDFFLPAPNIDNKRVYAYLCKARAIPARIVQEVIDLGLLYQDIRGNCVFVCMDSKAAVLRGTMDKVQWRGMVEGSDASYPWVLLGQSPNVVFCESPIDCLSFSALFPQSRTYTICSINGLKISAVERAVAILRPKVLVLAFDNDEYGLGMQAKLVQKYKDSYKMAIRRPCNKDWNEDLVIKSQQNSGYKLPSEESI
jgi:hypothetical protein